METEARAEVRGVLRRAAQPAVPPVSFLTRARPHLDRAIAAALLERLHLGDLPRRAGVGRRAGRLGRDRRARVPKGPDQAAVRAALAEGIRLGVALGLPVDGVAVGARLDVVGDRSPKLPLALARGGGVERGDQQGEENEGYGERSHRHFTRARIARSRPRMVVGYMRPPMISLRMPID